MREFMHDANDDNDAKAKAIPVPQVFSKNSRAKNFLSSKGDNP